MILKVVVISRDKDQVNIHLPMEAVKSGRKRGMSLPQIGSDDVLQGIDLDRLISMAEEGARGKLVEVKSVKGDLVEIFVEEYENHCGF